LHKLVREQRIRERRTVAGLVVRVSNIVDANPDREQRVRRLGILGRVSCREPVHLVDKRENGRVMGFDQRGVDGSIVVCEVVREDDRVVRLRSCDVDLVLAAARGSTRVGWVAERVTEAGGAGVAAIKSMSSRVWYLGGKVRTS
jgi:hypothetical protein